ncbi:T9SS type A sorting domain-containing protein [Pontibacter sp. KCTC 32443]|uniref:LamG-like jellyroll fold domain-containing protein n=1 Tax=Pontibacter TaxID=323449 RepID=UPI00164E3B85|nr:MULTISPECIES: LamG-like jellyroll fold domain-containing protein [Pontibacter]MBC5772970.1 T9SS type A sorting domain-containing protein [Pontibacter sp. KCTC 32443]
MIYNYSYAYVSKLTHNIEFKTFFTQLIKGGCKSSFVAIAAAFFLLLAIPASAQCPPNLVHYFPLDETTPGSYTDKIKAIEATCTDCPAPASSLFAGGQKFNGTNDAITINDVAGFEWGHYDSFTIELWVQVSGTASKNRVIMGRSATDSQMSWWVGVDTEGYAVFELYDMKRKGFKIEKVGKKINDGKWHHIVVMRHGTHLRNKLYIDGYRAADFRYEYSDNFYSASPVTIGWHKLDNGYHFSGSLDEIMVYNRALEENEVRARYNNGASVYCGTENIPPVITSEPITFGTVGQPYTYDVQAIGKPAPVYTLVQSPQGMGINSTTGEITWNPTTAGKFRVTVKVANSSGEVQQSFDISIKNGMGESAGIIHHWMLHEVSGVRYKDFYTPYDAVSDEAARPAPTAGVISGGQRFNGTTTGLDVSNSSNFNWNPNESFSMELWVRTATSSGNNRVLLGRQAADSEMHWWIGIDPQGYAGFQLLDILWQGTFVGKSGPKLNDGKWHQVVAVRDGGANATRLYVDGERVAEASFNYANTFASESPVTIGYLNQQIKYRFDGDLDEVKLFGRALTDAEIQERYETIYDGIVELVKFDGRYENKTVILDWETQTEDELSHFVIERSENGVDFTEIGTVEAKGNSTTLLAYTFTDAKPINGTGYYRLRIVKMNNAFTYSHIVTIHAGRATSSLFYVYPNPVQGGEVNVEVDSLVPDERVVYILSSMTGKTIGTEEMQVNSEGILNFKINVPEHLSAGIYIISIVSNTKTISRKLVLVD